ncbi:MAG TPA: hypothetical protein VGF38_17660 [Ktedonobacterales bacterium]|jgi:hypothetical protein
MHDVHGQPGRQRPVQTLARAYAAIAAHTDPWVALNEFFHEWFDYSRAERLQLIVEDVLPGGLSILLDTPSGELPRKERDRRWRWAVFCTAAADYLCMRDEITPPAWVADPRYTLAEPWYYFGIRDPLTPEEQAYLEQATPDLLRRRNVFCGDRVFANKYEFANQVQRFAVARAELPRGSEGEPGD